MLYVKYERNMADGRRPLGFMQNVSAERFAGARPPAWPDLPSPYKAGPPPRKNCSPAAADAVLLPAPSRAGAMSPELLEEKQDTLQCRLTLPGNESLPGSDVTALSWSEKLNVSSSPTQML